MASISLGLKPKSSQWPTRHCTMWPQQMPLTSAPASLPLPHSAPATPAVPQTHHTCSPGTFALAVPSAWYSLPVDSHKLASSLPSGLSSNLMFSFSLEFPAPTHTHTHMHSLSPFPTSCLSSISHCIELLLLTYILCICSVSVPPLECQLTTEELLLSIAVSRVLRAVPGT